MADETLPEIYVRNPVTTLALTDLLYVAYNYATTAEDAGISVDSLRTVISKYLTRHVCVTIAAPNGYYTNVRPQIPLFRASAALTITRIHLQGPDSTPTSELAGDLKYADDIVTGSFANAVVIDVCDTTSGVFTATSSFDDATVPSGKYVYFSLDAAPHVDWADLYLEVYYTFD